MIDDFFNKLSNKFLPYTGYLLFETLQLVIIAVIVFLAWNIRKSYKEYSLPLSAISFVGSIIGYFASYSRESASPEIVAAFCAIIGGTYIFLLFEKKLKGRETPTILAILSLVFSIYYGTFIGRINRESYEKNHDPITNSLSL